MPVDTLMGSLNVLFLMEAIGFRMEALFVGRRFKVGIYLPRAMDRKGWRSMGLARRMSREIRAR